MVFSNTGRKRLPWTLSLRIELILDQAGDRHKFSFRVKLERGIGVPVN